ncbi:hypothetical protein Saga11_16230 [Bacillus safensis]|nr:hypothetical protein Saga11_16230 [Bacillus safensis]
MLTEVVLVFCELSLIQLVGLENERSTNVSTTTLVAIKYMSHMSILGYPISVCINGFTTN